MNSQEKTAAFHCGAPVREARVICVAIHGRYGAPEAMMEHLVSRLTAPGVHYVLPRAEGDGWYAAPTCAPMTAETGAEIAAALDQIRADTESALREAPESARLVIGGFSQGACMSLEYAAAFGAWNGAAFALTGCRVGAAGDPRPSASLEGFPVYMSTGSRDPFIRLPEFAQAVHTMTGAGARVRSDIFPRSDHVMSPVEVATVDALLRRVACGETLFDTAGT